MAKKKGFSISLPGIIFMVIAYNFIFDDNDKNEVEIVDDNKPVIEKTVDTSVDELKKNLHVVAKDAKNVLTKLKEDVTKEFESKNTTPPEPEPEDKGEEEIVVVEKDPTPPITNPENDGMKKL